MNITCTNVMGNKNLIALIVIVFCLFSAPAFAVPTLSFSGSVSYSQAQSAISVNGTLVSFADLSTTPQLAGSNFQFHSTLVSSDSSGGFTTGVFDSSATTGDLTAVGNDGTALLGGEILTLSMLGKNGATIGSLFGDVAIDSGSLLADFVNPTELLALQLNISSPFGPNLFAADFVALVSGTLSSAISVPEPSTLALLGLVLLGLAVNGSSIKRLPKSPIMEY